MLKCRSFFINIVLIITAAFLLSSCAGNGDSPNAVDDSKAPVSVTANEEDKPSANPVTGETGTKAAEAEPAKTPEAKQEDADSITVNIYDFIPEGWIILEQNGEKAIKECDYDKNGNTDLVFVIEKVSDNGTAAPRTLMVARGNGDWTYTPAVEAKNAVFNADEGGIWGDPLEGIEIRNGSLYLNFYGGSSWRWEKRYQFRYQDGDWYLIGATDSFINISTNEGTVKDYNLLTGDYIIKETSKDGKVHEKKGNFNKRYKYNLSGFDVRNEDVFAF